jgi:hypothetical protein
VWTFINRRGGTDEQLRFWSHQSTVYCPRDNRLEDINFKDLRYHQHHVFNNPLFSYSCTLYGKFIIGECNPERWRLAIIKSLHLFLSPLHWIPSSRCREYYTPFSFGHIIYLLSFLSSYAQRVHSRRLLESFDGLMNTSKRRTNRPAETQFDRSRSSSLSAKGEREASLSNIFSVRNHLGNSASSVAQVFLFQGGLAG